MSEFKVNTITNRDGSYGPQVCGITTFRSSGMQLPSGPTEMRGGRGRAVFLRGYVPSTNNTMDFVNIATTGNAVDFGDTVSSYVQFAAAGSATRGIVSGGNTPAGESYYYTFSSGGGVNDFGNQTAIRRGCGACNDSTRAVFGGGIDNLTSPYPFYNVIDFFTFSTTGDANNFGELALKTRQVAGCSSPTRGLFAGGYDPAVNNVIGFITIQSTGNAQDFGDLTIARSSFGGGSNATRGLFASGFANPTNYNVIDYVTIATLGNATDFGDTLQTGVHNTGTACSQTRALFAGGYVSPTPSTNIISFATIATTGNAIDFGDLTVAGAVGNDGAASDVNGGIQQ
jgi:hypothetical protein